MKVTTRDDLLIEKMNCEMRIAAMQSQIEYDRQYLTNLEYQLSLNDEGSNHE